MENYVFMMLVFGLGSISYQNQWLQIWIGNTIFFFPERRLLAVNPNKGTTNLVLVNMKKRIQ